MTLIVRSSVKSYKRVPDKAWLFHPLARWLNSLFTVLAIVPFDLEFSKLSKANKILTMSKKSHQFYQCLKICEEIIGKYVPNYFLRDYDSKLYAEGVRRDLDLVRAYINKEGLVLDLGCGKGHLSAILADCGYSVIGIDITTPIEEQLRISETKWQLPIWKKLARRFNNYYLLGDGRFLPFQTEIFDVIIGYALIEHIPDNLGGLPLLLSEVNRVLKHDGLFFVFRCPRKQSYAEKLASALKIPHHEKLLSENTIAKLLEEHNFSVKEIEKTDMIIAFPPKPSKMLQQIWNFFWLPLSYLDRILLKTPLSQIAHNISVIARKRSIEEV